MWKPTARSLAWTVLAIALPMSLPAAPRAQTAAGDTHMDADMRKVLDKLTELGARPVEGLTPAEARRQPTPADAVKAVMEAEGRKTPQPALTTRDITYDGATGPLAARLYAPEQRLALGDRVPLIVYFHGGGWVIGDIAAYAASAQGLAANTPAMVLSVEYRKAPEHPLPAAHDDALAAWRWALANAAELGADPSRVAVAGESAGGNLAINVAIRARAEGLPAPAHMVLIYPVASATMDTASNSKHVNAAPLSKAGMEWFLDKAVTSDQGRAAVDVLKADLAGLPPATIITAEIDPLQSDGQRLAQALRRAGAEVRHQGYDGVTHEFFGMAPYVSDAVTAQEFVAGRLREAFTRPATSTNSRRYREPIVRGRALALMPCPPAPLSAGRAAAVPPGR
jgi:acetyl esterase